MEQNNNCDQSTFTEFISKPEINFWTPILFTAISITMSFMVLKNQVELQNQKLDTLIAGQNELIKKYEIVEDKIRINENAITLLNTNQKLVMKNLDLQ